MPLGRSSTATTSEPAAIRGSRTSRRWSTASSTAGASRTPGSTSSVALGLLGGLRLRIAACRHPWADHRDLVLVVSLDQQRLVGYPEDLFRPLEIKRIDGSQGSPDHAGSPLGILDPVAQCLGPAGENVEGVAEITPLGLNRRKRLADLGGVLFQGERQMSDPDAIEKSGHRRRRQYHDVVLATHRLQQAGYPVDFAVEALAGQIHHGKFHRPLTDVLA